MTDQHPFGEYVAALTHADPMPTNVLSRPIELRRAGARVNLLDLPPRTDDTTNQPDALTPSRELTPLAMFGVCHAGRSMPDWGSR